MDPLSPDSGQDSDLTDSPPTRAREQGLAPAGSLMSLQIRRRMPAKDRLLGPPPRAVRPDSPPAFAGPKPQKAMAAPDSKPAPTPAPTIAPEPDPAPEPTRIASTEPETVQAATPTAAPTPPAPVPTQPLPTQAAAPAASAAPTPAAPVPAKPLPDIPPPAPQSSGPRLPPASPIADPGRRAPAASASEVVPPAPPVATPPRRAALPPLPPAPPSPIDPAPIASAATTPSPLSSPGIARYARTGEHARRAEDKAVPVTPQAAPEARSATSSPPPSLARSDTPAPAPVRPEGIVSHWLRLRGSRRYPSKADLDQQRIARDWPNSILMRCRSGSKVLEPEKVFAGPKRGAPAAPGGQSPAAMELSPMMLQWLLTLATDAAQERRPMQDIETFPSLNKSIRYGAIALPFSEDQTRIDHVLCHVFRAP